MTQDTELRRRQLEGRTVSVALRDGSRIDACQLVAFPRHGSTTIWLFVDGADVFVDATDVLELWELRAA
jgi:hypothetical protein